MPAGPDDAMPARDATVGTYAVAGLALAATAAAAWLALLAGMPAGDSVAAHLAAWVVMMTAMMLPAAAPMILLFDVSSAGRGPLAHARSTLFVAGYLLVWAGIGLAALAARSAFEALPEAWRHLAAAAALAVAGIYQFTPLKGTCLRACRSPADFLVTHWRSGRLGPLRLGIDHGVYCVGCCWALMAVLVLVGGMGLGWVTLIALVVFAEKVLPRGVVIGRAVGVALLGLAALALARPDLIPGQMEVSM